MTAVWLDSYFAGSPQSFAEIPLALQGSEFQQIVWRLLLEIPFGKRATYGELAQKTASIMGKRSMSAQAIGGAVAHNPVAVIVPCHRVIAKSGQLAGYAAGLELKRKLLDFEDKAVGARQAVLGAAQSLKTA